MFWGISGDYYDDPNYDYDGSASGDDYEDYEDYEDVSGYVTEEVELDYFPEMITRPQKVTTEAGGSATLPCEANVRINHRRTLIDAAAFSIAPKTNYTYKSVCRQ